MSNETPLSQIMTSSDGILFSCSGIASAAAPSEKHPPECDAAHQSDVELRARLLHGRSRIQFWELYDRAFMGNRKRKAAIWDLIDRGVLTPVIKHERVTDLSSLTINATVLSSA